MKKSLVLIIILFSLIFADTNKEKRAIDFVLKDINNKNVKLSDTVKKYPLTVVNFWATWCMPCRAELKDLNKLYKQYKNKNVHIISISIDDPKTAGRVKSFARANKIKHDVWLDTNNEVMRKYHINNPPFTMLIDKDMNVIYEHTGYRKGDIVFLKKEIDQLFTKEK